MLRQDLVNQTKNSVVDYLREEMINVTPNMANDIGKLIDNNLGFLVEAVEEAAVEVKIESEANDG